MNYKNKVKNYLNNEIIFLQLEKYVDLIESNNKVMNLTGFKDDRLWEEGIYESIISLEKVYDPSKMKTVLDIGAGAGFPSIPFYICHPEILLTIYEPVNKKVEFLLYIKEKLNLVNLRVLRQRVEESQEINYFDLITARAVIRASILLEISFNLAKIGGTFAFVKGPNVVNELQKSKHIMKLLQIKPEIIAINIGNDKKVNILSYQKTRKNLRNFPRKWSELIKNN